MLKHNLHKVLLLSFLFATSESYSQQILENIGRRIPGQTGGVSNQQAPGNDSLRARNKFEDSVTVTIYYLDSVRGHQWDTSVRDFTNRFPIPAHHIYLGNLGTATRSLLFAPQPQAGFDPGFHALDVYKWKLPDVRFFNTTRPFTELGYILGSRAEQTIEVFHTQNIKPNWNAAVQYRLINAPGFFRNQKSNHNNYLFTSWFQSKNKRYNNYFAVVGNKLQVSENGGILHESYLDSVNYARDRYTLPTNIGGSPVFGTNFLSNTLHTGHQHNEFNVLLRQQYDFGKKDSIVTDSTIIPLFYPRLRLEHSFKLGTYRYTYEDKVSSVNIPDSSYYDSLYRFPFPDGESIFFRDTWKEISNDFSIYQYPDAKNLSQFIKLGAELQLMKGRFIFDSTDKAQVSLHNIIGHAEYRNRTRNQKWDMLAWGKLHLAGDYLGDYHAYVHLQRLSQKIGSVQAGFENINRTPPYIFNERSGFYFDDPKNFSKENTTHFFGSLQFNKLKLKIGADYYLLSNYLYFTEYYRLRQETSLFNVLRLHALKTSRIGRNLNWHGELYVQRQTGNVQLNIPLVVTRHRVMYEGNLGFKNLNLATGLEARYHTPYKADGYSPVLAQFTYQDSLTISNLPDIAAFLHFRIRTFKAYIRAENLNTVRFFRGFQFNNNNLAAPQYPTPGLVIRFGIYWVFVN